MQHSAYLQGRSLAKAAVEAIRKSSRRSWILAQNSTFAAVPDLAVRSDLEDEDEEYTVSAESHDQAVQQQSSAASLRQQRQSEWRNLTPQEVAAQLKLHQNATSSCSTPDPSSKDNEQPISDWRTVLALAKQLQPLPAASAADMLTDTFGCEAFAAPLKQAWPAITSTLKHISWCAEQAQAYLSADITHRAVQPEMPVLHASRRH